MIIYRVNQVNFSYFNAMILDEVTYEFQDQCRIGLIGANGSGKSTFLKLIAGILKPDEGVISAGEKIQIAYLEQEPYVNNDGTIWDEAFSSNQPLFTLEHQLAEIETALGLPDVYGQPTRLAQCLHKQELALAEYERLGGLNYEGKVRSTLRQFGFSDETFDRSVSVLSGGQKKLLALCRIALSDPDFILLDEPDNHLDLEGKQLLESFIQNFRGAVLVVSHDRYLLDVVINQILELETGKLQEYSGNYSEYVFEKEQRLLRQQTLFQAQQKEISRLEQSAKRLLTWGKVYDNNKFIRRGMNMLKRLERIERIDRPELDPNTIRLELEGWRGSDIVLKLTGVSKTFRSDSLDEPFHLFQKIDYELRHGDRVGLVGVNGVGKSYLLKAIIGENEVDEGQMSIGPSVRYAYYSQQHESLDYEGSLIDAVQNVKSMAEQRCVAFLLRFLFSYDQIRGKVKDLSGGERSRLQLALIMLTGANFLLLDEPTNHLDITSIEVLEDAIQEFSGSLLIVSHDRYFLDRVCTKIIELKDAGLSEFDGNYSDYLAAIQKRPI